MHAALSAWMVPMVIIILSGCVAAPSDVENKLFSPLQPTQTAIEVMSLSGSANGRWRGDSVPNLSRTIRTKQYANSI